MTAQGAAKLGNLAVRAIHDLAVVDDEFDSKAKHSRKRRAAMTMLASDDFTSGQPRIFRPQSGFTHRFSTGRTCAALAMKVFLSSMVGARDE